MQPAHMKKSPTVTNDAQMKISIVKMCSLNEVRWLKSHSKTNSLKILSIKPEFEERGKKMDEDEEGRKKEYSQCKRK